MALKEEKKANARNWQQTNVPFEVKDKMHPDKNR